MTTIYDVAKLAGVSPGTVSNAFNKPHIVKPKTYEKILEATRQLNYRPNVLAQALAGGKTQMVGILVFDLRYPYSTNICSGIENVLTEKGYITILASAGDFDTMNRLLGQLRRRGVEGFILVPVQRGLNQAVEQTLTALRLGGVPVVVAGMSTNSLEIDWVTYRPQAAAKEVVDYLVSLGHQRIGYIGAQHSKGFAILRWLGYQEGVLANNLTLDMDLVVETNLTSEECRQAALHLLSLPNPPTALFAMSEVATTGILDACYQLGRRIPEDVSVVSFDYMTMMQRQVPAISGVVIPTYEMGQRAATLLVNRLEKPDLPPQHENIVYTIEGRETTAVHKAIP